MTYLSRQHMASRSCEGFPPENAKTKAEVYILQFQEQLIPGSGTDLNYDLEQTTKRLRWLNKL